ncbi:hypothetical protein B0T26DRAFT_366991 [Lasiosphaeria miniovina]|uniref:Uncharacterized protein n=1 Tax=Lasiosphaeria miniovina TaxID=1954250 RepID=A0AA40DS69_9PEZI|nr:uncharacterized protein B0T26DRAFT_366991 [Lasiosphaeria miniovina]KAK0713585.1 hypothetical protein B0T26DRAFT_366991 [Lasiosphaeria miniovina]
MTTNATQSTVIFNGPEDWHAWADALKAKATQVNLWQYFEGTEWPEEPTFPEPRYFDQNRTTTTNSTVEDDDDEDVETQLLQTEVDRMPPPPTHGIRDPNNADYPRLRGAALQKRREKDQRVRQELAAQRHNAASPANDETILSERGKEQYNMAITRYTRAQRQYDKIQKEASTLLD